MNDHSISFVVTTYNRTDLLYECTRHALEHPLVSEILIVDDCSPMTTTAMIWQYYQDYKKVRVKRNGTNIGCYHNKAHALAQASNEWVVIADSDNLFDNEYFNRIETLMVGGVNPRFVYQPSFAKPHFDFKAFEGMNIERHYAAANAHNEKFTTMLNAMNYFVNRDEYLKVWQEVPEPWTSDSLLQNYNWLAAGNSIYVVPGLQYDHRIHDGSHYREHVGKNGNLHNELIDKLRAL